MEHHTAVARMCQKESNVVSRQSTDLQGRSACGESGQRGLGELLQRHEAIRRNLQMRKSQEFERYV